MAAGARRTPEPPAAVPPTPQTVARLRADVIGRLVARGRLDRAQAAAAAEIRAVCEAAARGMFPTARLLDGAGRRGRAAVAFDFWERMSAAERRAWEGRYLPWTGAMARATDPRLPGPRWLGLVRAIVVHNVGLRAAERAYGLRHGTAVAWLARGLDLYLDLGRGGAGLG